MVEGLDRIPVHKPGDWKRLHNKSWWHHKPLQSRGFKQCESDQTKEHSLKLHIEQTKPFIRVGGNHTRQSS